MPHRVLCPVRFLHGQNLAAQGESRSAAVRKVRKRVMSGGSRSEAEQKALKSMEKQRKRSKFIEKSRNSLIVSTPLAVIACS